MSYGMLPKFIMLSEFITFSLLCVRVCVCVCGGGGGGGVKGIGKGREVQKL